MRYRRQWSGNSMGSSTIAVAAHKHNQWSSRAPHSAVRDGVSDRRLTKYTGQSTKKSPEGGSGRTATVGDHVECGHRRPFAEEARVRGIRTLRARRIERRVPRLT